jgi:lipopolysaccharide/colanic/teichoic acid biosynthesis glycosyltransferase
MKRIVDVVVSFTALVVLSPVLIGIACAVWLWDFHSPWFRGVRVSRGGGEFRMVKFRSMRPDAWKSGVNSTAAGDSRITPIGKFLRATKLDELPQLWNVLIGDMSLVGPRPQVQHDAALYTEEEQRMLDVRPGITDLASIVFADEGAILAGSDDPDLRYNRIIRPWKSRLALLYVQHAGVFADMQIVLLTAIALVSRPAALKGVSRMLRCWKADENVARIALRTDPLPAYPPPGATAIVEHYRTAPLEAAPAKPVSVETALEA